MSAVQVYNSNLLYYLTTESQRQSTLRQIFILFEQNYQKKKRQKRF